MRRSWFALLLVAGAVLAALPVAPAVQSNESTRRALLVGVTNYPNLPAKLHLEGPANDVVLMRATLTTHFGVPAGNVVTLSEAEGTKNPALYPTRAAIEREFKRLAELARPGDEIVIALGGHGSQQPEKAGAPDPEPDGFDEIFLPRDVGKWDGGTGAVANAITDDELGAWVAAVRAKRAFVWLVVDACHSGTMLRGTDDVERPRKTDPVADLGIPEKVVAEAATARVGLPPKGGRPKTRGGEERPAVMGIGGQPGVFALYAAQPTETTPERPMPMDGATRTQHGLLSYTVCQVLTQSKTAGVPVSYRELAQRVQGQYAAWGRTSPTPMIEYPDTDPDREVLGPGVWKDRANILVAPAGDHLRINAGRLVGLTPGSVLEVRPPAGVGNDPVGFVRVTDARTVDADVEPVAYGGKAAPAEEELPAGARCKIAFIDGGEARLRVAVATHFPGTGTTLTPVPAAARDPLVARLTKAADPGLPYRLVADPKEASWVVAPLSDGRVSLLPAAGWAGSATAGQAKGYGPVPTDEKLEPWLADALGRIARAEGLVKLAASRDAELLAAGDLAPKLKTDLFRLDDATKELTPLRWPATDLEVFDRDRVRMKVTNTGRVPFDLTVLYVDTDHAIGGLFPTRGASNRVPVGGSLTVPIGIQSTTVGPEHVALIAVKAEGLETDFLSLAQKGPERMRGTAQRGDDPAARTAKRFAFGVYGLTDSREATRGAAADVAEDHAMMLINWTVRATPRSKDGRK